MKKYYILAAAAISLAACNNDNNYIDGPVEAQFCATIGESSVTRASEKKWGSGDQIGITMGDRYTNIKYTTQSGDGVFTGSTLYFKNKREPIDISAYYPFTGPEGSVPEVNTSTSSDRQTPLEQPKFDFLFASMSNVTGQNPNVSLNFAHMMSKLTLTFENGNEGTDVSKIVSYMIDGLILEGTFNTTSGLCSANPDAGAETLSIVLPQGTVVAGQAVQSLIVFPQPTAGKNITLRISDSEGQDYACTLNFGNDGIVSGNNYQYTIKVKKTGLSVNSEITGWNDIPLNSEAGSAD